ncbi:hypothetical protein BCV70DRAFT_168186 [Testicularia cyperi]|uniref:Uncharacterized protein n=1 Tax=Testicularia cyperi TaxID=1882483 RepID=A0A317XG44_9BASI|nr:hypothetical protein BCV70DRAFT_168186 [Testicularia cyperi]
MSQVESQTSAVSAPTTLSQSTDDTGSHTGAIEPPDTVGAVAAAIQQMDIAANSAPSSHTALGSSYPPPASRHKLPDRLAHSNLVLHGIPTSASLAQRAGRHFAMTSSASAESGLHIDGALAVPASPSMSDCLTDSPGSVSSMSSFRRGDLADIEDLDLEPELETVSECDEESSSLCSLDIGVEMDSDSERTSSHNGDLDHPGIPYGLGLSHHSARNGSLRPAPHGTAASDYARRKRSEWLLNNYANKIAARRPRRVKKGRITEIVEEGGENIQTTVMPKAPLATHASEWTCEVSGPPAPPPRSVSPSDTVPAVPSPLCSCVNADGSINVSVGLDESVETLRADDDAVEHIRKSVSPAKSPLNNDSGTSATASATLSEVSGGSRTTDEQLPQQNGRSPQTSPVRVSSRRNSSPPRLRPCFRRRPSDHSAASTRESSCERDQQRGRSVRFSSRPPQEVRTHSPVEYDRKSCPVNNRLSPADVEELRTMKMEMGLLEAKWAAVAACKPVKVAGTEGTTKRGNENVYNAGVAAISAAQQRPKACGAESDSTLGPGAFSSPSARLRQQKERERQQERQRNMPHYMRDRNGPGRASASSDALSVRSKFGHAPPPPLPGMPSSRSSASPSPSPSRSSFGLSDNGAGDSRPTSYAMRSYSPSPSRGPSVSDVPMLTRTGPSPPTSPTGPASASPASLYEAKRGRQPASGQASSSASTRSSAASSPSVQSIYSSTYYPSSQPSMPSHPCLGGSGYDSPASEFYESGSEYDLIC